MTIRTLRNGLLVLLVASIAALAFGQTVLIDAFDPTLREIEETQTALERAKRVLADRDELADLRHQLLYLSGQLPALRSDLASVVSAQREVLAARERLSHARSELDRFWGNGGLLRWLQDALFISRGPAYVFNDAIHEAQRNLEAAQAQLAAAERSLEARGRPLVAALGTADPSALERLRNELQTRIRDASIAPDQVEQLRSNASALSERLDQLHGERRDATSATAAAPVTEADVGGSQRRIDVLERDIEFFESALQNTRVLLSEAALMADRLHAFERAELRDILVSGMREGRFTPEQAIGMAQHAVAFDAYVRSLMRGELDTLRARRSAELAQRDALVAQLRQDAGSGVTHELWVGTTLKYGMEITARPQAYGGTVSYWRRGIPDGTTITLTAPATHTGTPAPWDWTFVEWTGCDAGPSTTCTVTLTGSRSVSVDYAPGCYAWRRVWDTHCSGPIEPGAHGDTLTAHNTMPRFAGSATYRCDRGTWVRLSSTCTRTD